MNTSTPKIDRRVQRTRQLLRDALMALIVEKGYDAISVQDITDHANVARPTFYLHYKDKEELLLSSVQEIYDDLAQNHPVVSYEDVPKEDLINFHRLGPLRMLRRRVDSSACFHECMNEGSFNG